MLNLEKSCVLLSFDLDCDILGYDIVYPTNVCQSVVGILSLNIHARLFNSNDTDSACRRNFDNCLLPYSMAQAII
jgi:hypothetical protein